MKSKVDRINRANERKGLARLRAYFSKYGHTFTVDQGHGHDGFLDGVVPVEVKSNTKDRPQDSFPAGISATQLNTLLAGGLLVLVNPKAIRVYDKTCILRLYTSYRIAINQSAALDSKALTRHVRLEKARRGGR